eukprot:symbB.v1.2.004721.t1/scaffold219.1/size262806/1
MVLAVDGDKVLAICLNRPAPKPPTGRPAPTVRTAAPRRSRGSLGGFGAARSLKTEAAEEAKAVHFGGDEDFDRWTCLSAGDHQHCADATPLGASGLWWVRNAAEAWRTRRLSSQKQLFARGAVRFGSLELELSLRHGEMGLVQHWTPELRDVVNACCSYEGPGARGVRLGLYGDHHGFGLWE